MIAKKTVEDIDLACKTVLVRVDFNVPFAPGTTQVSDDSRIRASVPTIEYLRRQGCRVVLCSHVGRPGGKIVEGLRLAPVSERLSQILGAPVAQADDCVGASVKAMAASLGSRGRDDDGEYQVSRGRGDQQPGVRRAARGAGRCVRQRRLRRGAQGPCFRGGHSTSISLPSRGCCSPEEIDMLGSHHGVS